MAKKNEPAYESKVIDQQMGEILSERYLSYASVDHYVALAPRCA